MDQIVAESSKYSDPSLDFGMLNSVLLQDDNNSASVVSHNKSGPASFIDASPNFSMSVSSTSGSSASPGTVDPRMVSSSFSSQGTSDKQKGASSTSSLTPGNGQPYIINSFVPDSEFRYTDPSLLKNQEINLADLLSKLQNGFDFVTQGS